MNILLFFKIYQVFYTNYLCYVLAKKRPIKMCTKLCSLTRCGVIAGCFLLLVDLILDWAFYIVILNTTQEGFNNAYNLKTAILVFAIVGIIVLVLIFLASIAKFLVNREGTLFHEKAAEILIILTAVGTWIEDLPQILLALIVGLKAKEPFTFIQYAKAWFALFEAVLLIIVLVVRMRPCCEDKPRKWKRILFISEIIGHVTVIVVSLFLLVQLYSDKLS